MELNVSGLGKQEFKEHALDYLATDSVVVTEHAKTFTWYGEKQSAQSVKRMILEESEGDLYYIKSMTVDGMAYGLNVTGQGYAGNVVSHDGKDYLFPTKEIAGNVIGRESNFGVIDNNKKREIFFHMDEAGQFKQNLLTTDCTRGYTFEKKDFVRESLWAWMDGTPAYCGDHWFAIHVDLVFYKASRR